MPTEPNHTVTVTVIDLNAEVRKIWGVKWNAPTKEYEFSNGRVFERRTEESAVYSTSPDFG